MSYSLITKELGIFGNLPFLGELDLHGNCISDIMPSAFHQLVNLYLLDLSDTCLQILNAGIFTGLKNLQYLNLNDNYF